MDGEVVWIGIVPMLLTLGVGLLLSLLRRPGKAAERRRRRMRAAAEGLGLRYLGTAGPEAIELLPPCSLFAKGQTRTVTNLIGDDGKPPRRLLFDYERDHGPDDRSGLQDSEGLHLVAMARLPGGSGPPQARIYRADWFGGPIGVKDVYRLEFEDDPAFGNKHWLAGEPRHAVRAMLTREVRETMKGWSVGGPKPVIEVTPGWVVVHVESHQTDGAVAEKAGRLLDYAAAVAGQLARQAPG
jgi:hypothetical protein